MDRWSTVGEMLGLVLRHRKFYTLPVLLVLLVLAGLTASVQTGVVALVYPI